MYTNEVVGLGVNSCTPLSDNFLPDCFIYEDTLPSAPPFLCTASRAKSGSAFAEEGLQVKVQVLGEQEREGDVHT
jgi:hypothetical protein